MESAAMAGAISNLSPRALTASHWRMAASCTWCRPTKPTVFWAGPTSRRLPPNPPRSGHGEAGPHRPGRL